ncbi:Cytolysin, a secreted calcineurin-like phosphatase [Candidatus Liberibacter americanus str. Sao Paulo]|uniref:Cytolysin, a secreted calcineurin-like phosphatase n=1 Tax=Candidatus Liberibacter americanus str. Sao Paulo TaxID=1261131 RepID=U6B8P7_9HYPH|nr:hypothetical protein [Candidatus Liberibacter americanus]AHA28216.1 Cytolysin, a secreted calcineurin-like phosphatase [Candidatus Liberibacter americanus str. Sao Paulo]
MFKNKYLNNILYLSKNGNIAILAALLFPFIVMISIMAIDISRYFLCKNYIEMAILKAIEDESSNVCVENSSTVETRILNNIRITLSNSFNSEDINRLLHDTKVKLQFMHKKNNEFDEYILEVNSYYSIETDPVIKAIGFPKMNMKINISQFIRCTNISGILMADINIWRPITAEGFTKQQNRFSEKERHDWEISNKEFISKVKQFSFDKKVYSYILSGNMTDFGEENQTYEFEKTILNGLPDYSSLDNKTIVYPSMGPAEYFFNVDNCKIDDFILFNSGCAFNVVRHFLYNINKIKNDNPNHKINFDSNYEINTVIGLILKHNITKSQAYSWDIGNLHFIQTNHNLFYHTYLVDYLSRVNVNIEPMIEVSEKVCDWLISDIKKAKSENKKIFIITSNLDERYNHIYSYYQDYAFKKLLKDYNVSAIISTSDYTHNGFYGQTPIYYIGHAWKKILFYSK